MIIDIHAHLWDGRFERDKREIVKACRVYNISRACISSLGSHFPGMDEISRLNSETHKFMMEEPELIDGFCYINPWNSDCLDMLKRGIEDFGMSGMKLWVATCCDDPKVFPLAEKCIEYKVPVLVHAFHKATGQLESESRGTNVGNLALKYSELKIIMAHLGANCHRELKPVQNFKNVSVDISGTIFRRDDIDYTKKLLGASRILFGTDMPGATFLANYGQIEEADLDSNERELIYYKNALRLLDRS